MAIKLLDFWQRNRPELDNVLEVGEFTANTTAAGLGLAIALGVVGATALPAAGIAAAGLGFAGSTRKVIELVANRWNKELTLEEVASLVTPVAYLDSFNYWIRKNKVLAAKIESEQSQEIHVDSKIKNLTLDHQLAINALSNFPTSQLALTFNEILSSQLIRQGLDETEAQIIASWVAWNAVDFFDDTLDKFRDSDNLQIINIYRNTVPNKDSRQYKSIEIYLAEQIATKPQETVFNEEFSFKDIYIPLKAAPVYAKGKVDKNESSFMVVEDWAKEMLLNPQKAKQVMFIQGGPGRGKSVFCRMFADWVCQKIHPLWIPILIRLRDIVSFEGNVDKILQSAVKANFAKDDSWLTDSKLRFLFLLDGFDELRMEGRAKGVVECFIKEVGSFQERCDTSEMGHRFIVTGRQLALQGISFLPENLERVELLEMDDDLQEQWFDKWEKVVDENRAIAQKKNKAFKAFLKSDHLPQEVKEDLAREPLLLYLLAAMHRDGDIKVEDLEGTSGIQTKITIYEQALNWVLTEQQKPIQRAVKLEEDELSQVLIEAGLCVVQSGGECARVKMIGERLKKSEPGIVEKIEHIQNQDKDEVLKNALAAFYLKPAAGDEGGSVEFFHKSFGEFLCAKRMQQTLEEWTEPRRLGKGFNLNEYQLAEEIYDLLGYGVLTPEIMEYLWGLLAASQEFRPVELFNRLEDFYERWCDGEFIDADGTTLPQAKMKKLREFKPQLKQEQNSLGQRQVDVYTGLNVLILLMELHRYGQKNNDLQGKVVFYPCGQINANNYNKSRLLNLIGYSHCIEDKAFVETVGSFFANVELPQANLNGAYLSSANFSEANLSRVTFVGAYLSSANFSDANLYNVTFRGAYLSRADFTGAKLEHASLRGTYLIRSYFKGAFLKNAYFNGSDLRGADLRGADLNGADLTTADLRGADLRGADLTTADLGGILFDNKTKWEGIKVIETAVNVPEDLKIQLQNRLIIWLLKSNVKAEKLLTLFLISMLQLCDWFDDSV